MNWPFLKYSWHSLLGFYNYRFTYLLDSFVNPKSILEVLSCSLWIYAEWQPKKKKNVDMEFLSSSCRVCFILILFFLTQAAFLLSHCHNLRISFLTLQKSASQNSKAILSSQNSIFSESPTYLTLATEEMYCLPLTVSFSTLDLLQAVLWCEFASNITYPLCRVCDHPPPIYTFQHNYFSIVLWYRSDNNPKTTKHT